MDNKLYRCTVRSGKVYIPRDENRYVYDAVDPKKLVVELNSHIHLIKACITQGFIAETIYAKHGKNDFRESGDGEGYRLMLTGEGEISCLDTPLNPKSHEKFKLPVHRTFYLPVRREAQHYRAVPENAYVQIRNVQHLTSAFAGIYHLKSPDEIMKFAQGINRKLN